MASEELRTFHLIFTAAFLLSGCGAPNGLQTAPTKTEQFPADAVEEQSANDLQPDNVSEPAGTSADQNSFAVSEQKYISPSDSYQIALPDGWSCSETGRFQVNCHSPDQSAGLQAVITGTGYELAQDAFLSFAHAEMVHTYSEIKEFNEIDRTEEEGRLYTGASWRKGDAYWQSANLFVRESGTVFNLYVESQKEVSVQYTALFDAVIDSIEIFPAAMYDEMLYSQRTTYTARDSFFRIDIPTGWSSFTDAVTIENSVLEGFLSPDGFASIQTVVYRSGALIEQNLKAEKTLEIMRTLYGHDLRVSHDKALPDGRERLAWYAAGKDIHGVSYFDSYGSSLYVFTVIWEAPTEDMYRPVLEEIEASFERN